MREESERVRARARIKTRTRDIRGNEKYKERKQKDEKIPTLFPHFPHYVSQKGETQSRDNEYGKTDERGTRERTTRGQPRHYAYPLYF